MEIYIGNPSTGDKAKVTPAGLLKTHSVSESIVEDAAGAGNSFNINTGIISLTSASTSAMLYFKNNGEEQIHISTIGFLLGNSTGGTGDLVCDVVKNPTAGTIVSGATDVDINQNKNAGSSKVLTVNAYKGAEALTVTGGEAWYTSLLPGAGRGYVIATGTLVLTPGSSIGVSITPQTSNTAMSAQVFLSLIKYTL